MKQRKRRASSYRPRNSLNNNSSPAKNARFNANFQASPADGNELDSVLNDVALLGMDITVPGFEEGDYFAWDNGDPTPPSVSAPLGPTDSLSEAYDLGTQVNAAEMLTRPQCDGELTIEGMIGQITSISSRATRATMQLHCRIASCNLPLMVHSPEVNEAFENANTLIQILNNINDTNFNLSLPDCRSITDRIDVEQTFRCGLILLALASHHHVFTLFRMICASIRQSIGLGSPGQKTQHLEPTKSRDEASYAQFVMILRLILHLLNRLSRSLNLEMVGRAEGNAVSQLQQMTPEVEGEQVCCDSHKSSYIDAAQSMLRKVPDEHLKMKEIIRRLQVNMEEILHA